MPQHRSPIRSVLAGIDADALRDGVIAETRARQRHLPPISVYRWWARRAETVTGAIVDAVAAERPGERLLIADTFAGGGVIALSALLRGHRIYAQDVNPWAAAGLVSMLSLPDPGELEAAAERLHGLVRPILDQAYSTRLRDGTPATLAHTLRVATGSCPGCRRKLRLFPSSLVSLTSRIDCGGEEGFTVCPAGHLNRGHAAKRQNCRKCNRHIKVGARYTSQRYAKCHECGWSGKIAQLAERRPLGWDVALVERCTEGRREIDTPTAEERRMAAPERWSPRRALPEIAAGKETAVLRRHGMRHWHDAYPTRQRFVIEALLDACPTAAAGNDSVQRALEMAVIGSTEMAGHLSRWDSRYLKPYEAIANHRFNFTTLSAEPNVWGTEPSGRGTVDRRVAMMTKAAGWLDEHLGRRLRVVGPVPSDRRRGKLPERTDAAVVLGSSTRLTLPDESLDAAITDPPYHDDVQYGELSDLFRAWSGEMTGQLDGDAIVRAGTGSSDAVYERVLFEVFSEVGRALKRDGHLVLSYANRDPRAWISLFNSLQDAGFVVVGSTVVHSENETDHAKAGRRACTLDVLIDAVKKPAAAVEHAAPGAAAGSEEARFCSRIRQWALRVGQLEPGWESAFRDELVQEPFINAAHRR